MPKRDELFDAAFLARLERLHLLAKRLAAGARAGQRRGKTIGDGLEFADHRDYAPGDDTRFIDWPYYARMGKLLLRLFHQHSEADVVVLLDASASMVAAGTGGHSREKFDYALRVAAALAYVAMGSMDRVTLQPYAENPAAPLRTGRNRGRIFEVLDYLAGLAPGGRTRLEDCARRIAAGAEGGTLLLVTDLLDCERELSDALAGLSAAGFETTVLHVYSPADAAPRPAGPLLLHHAETDERMAVDATEDVTAAYARAWEAFAAGCERTCLSRGATYVAAGTDTPFEQLVLHSLRKAGVVSG